MQKKIKSALISVYYKTGLDAIILSLDKLGITIYSTGGTADFIESLGAQCVRVEEVTSYPSILGGRVKTLHPKIFGGILGKTDDAVHSAEMLEHNIPPIDLVVVDLYPFEETVASGAEEAAVIEKIDIGGPSMIRAAAKNYRDVVVIADRREYTALQEILDRGGETTSDDRRALAVRAFDVCTHYDNAVSAYFSGLDIPTPFGAAKQSLRYGENPHQDAAFFGEFAHLFEQLHGKALSYNNLVDVDAALALMFEFREAPEAAFAVIKHTNVCGAALRDTVLTAWHAALAGDPESAFGGILVSNREIDAQTATAISDIFFEVLIAPAFSAEALAVLQQKKNRILLQLKSYPERRNSMRSMLNGVLVQEEDHDNFAEWKEAGGRATTEPEQASLKFANIICKHLKSNAIAIVKKRQLIGKGCGQTSRVDALRNAIEKAKQFGADTTGAVLASDAFFPFDDCVRIAHTAGIDAFIQPGGSMRDNESLEYCRVNGLAMVLTSTRHFRH